jgi:predicted NAD/FAD-binding protein
VLRRFAYDHPVYTKAGVAAQQRHGEISNLARRTHFAGAYWGWGFHEDGVVSGLRAAAAIEGAAPAAARAAAAPPPLQPLRAEEVLAA